MQRDIRDTKLHAIYTKEHKSHLLEVTDLKTHIRVRGSFSIPNTKLRANYVRAVDGVSIFVGTGETVSVVGESGCGKTTLARTILGLTDPTSGSITLEGQVLRTMSKQRGRFRTVQMVFQDPDSSLDPTMRIMDTVAEPMARLDMSRETRQRKIVEVLSAVGLDEEFLERLPRQLSGGQKQRVNIARAIVSGPKLVILDEPTSALDASVQAQILNLLIDLQMKYRLSYLLITHNIAVAEYLSDRIYVMYAGRIAEHGPTKPVIGQPRHPYTIALISSQPLPDPRKRTILDIEVAGEVPSALNPPSGCRFHPRCPYAEDKCKIEEPQLELQASDGRSVACHFVNKTAPSQGSKM